VEVGLIHKPKQGEEMEHFRPESALNGMHPGEFASLSTEVRFRLRKYISQCCEVAFRRGFHQGHDSAVRGDTVADLEFWRFEIASDWSPSPHFTYSSDAENRHEIGCGMSEVGLT